MDSEMKDVRPEDLILSQCHSEQTYERKRLQQLQYLKNKAYKPHRRSAR